MIITLPAKFKSSLYTNIHYGGTIKLSRADLDIKYIYIAAFYNRNRRESFKEIIQGYNHTIDLHVSKKILCSGFKGVGEYAIVDINQYLSSKFDDFFIQYMNAFGFDHSKRYPRYDLGIEAFYNRYQIDEDILSREAMTKMYYRYRKDLSQITEFDFSNRTSNNSALSSTQ